MARPRNTKGLTEPLGIRERVGCAWCASDLRGRQSQARTCSNECRQALHRWKRRMGQSIPTNQLIYSMAM